MSSEITALKKDISTYEQGRKSAESFIALIEKYENFDTLTNTMLNEFVEKSLSMSVTARVASTPPKRLRFTSIS